MKIEMPRISHIIIHHSLTKDGRTVSWQAIRKYHMEKGWRDIGYHFGIEAIGDFYEILIGRLPTMWGAHCKEAGMNRTSLGICCVGNFDVMEPPTNQWLACVELTRSLMHIYNVPADNVKGHREYANYKSCPGKLWDMDKFRLALTTS